eukprot:g3235.t1
MGETNEEDTIVDYDDEEEEEGGRADLVKEEDAIPAPPPATASAVADPLLPVENDDPRPPKKGAFRKVGNKKGKGTNTESFDPKSTIVRPSMRVIVGRSNRESYGKSLKHDDVVVVPDFFCDRDDWAIYYKLIEEQRALQKDGTIKNAQWIGWHENCHLITKNPRKSPTFRKILEKTSKYFDTEFLPQATRFNWYKDSSDWKPFHHDSAAFNERRAKTQNITVGISFGEERELAFLNAKTGSRIYFPQTN